MKRRTRRRIPNIEFDDTVAALVAAVESDEGVRTSTVKQFGAYCHAIGEYCHGMPCLTCPVLATIEHTRWLCFKCVDDTDRKPLPYWEDTPCEDCGFTDGVRILTVSRRRYCPEMLGRLD